MAKRFEWDGKNYDAILLPTGETSFGERTFPVSKHVKRLFDTGKFGCVFVTGGYNGFARGGPNVAESEAKDTVGFLREDSIDELGATLKGIKEDKIYYDQRSLESVGNFTFPLVHPIYQNPSLDEFKNILVVGKKGHLWRLRDYAEIVMPSKTQVDFNAIPGEHNDGLAAKLYHLAIMNKIDDKNTPEDVHNFLVHAHPFYSRGWFQKDP